MFLCKNLVEILGGEIVLDDNYNSGIPGHPGTRFLVNLKRPPMNWSPELIHRDGPNNSEEKNSMGRELPESLCVLFVDDDPILRKLFSRMVKRVAPTWTIREAANGEAALRISDSTTFDLIFVDQYMASFEKQLLGTETVEALRGKGISCVICGLSANDKESEFLEAGADAFSMKPFPCEPAAMTEELYRVLKGDESL